MSSPGREPERRVLLGACGTGTSFAIATRLRSTWGDAVHLVGLDTNPRHLVATSVLCDDFIQAPPVKSQEFQPFLVATIRTRDIDTYVPILNDEIALASEISREGAFESISIAAPHAENPHLCCDKHEQSLWLSRLGVNAPKTSDSFDKISGSHLFVKPGNGFGSVAAEALPRNVVEGLDRSKLDGMIFQEICEGPEVTVDSFYDSIGNYQQVICRERLETKSGVCTKARLFQDEALAEIALSIGRGLNQRGTICFQVMQLHGEWAVTDLNFRPGAGTAMTCAAGWDVLSAMFACQWGEPYEGFFPSGPLERDIFVTRQYSEFIAYA